MFKHMILAMTLVFASACTTGFNGDKWATAQLELTAEIATCVKLLEKDIKTYSAGCSAPAMVQRAKDSATVMSLAIQKYPQGTATEVFLQEEFTYPDMGLLAIASMQATTTGLQYITRMLELDLAKKQQELEVQKATGIYQNKKGEDSI